MDKLKKNKQQRAESNKNLDKTSNIKSFIIIEPGLAATLKKNQLLTEDELVHYQNKFGKVSFIAKKLKKSKMFILKIIRGWYYLAA